MGIRESGRHPGRTVDLKLPQSCINQHEDFEGSLSGFVQLSLTALAAFVSARSLR
jgi:hypothetical protein